MRGRGHRIRQSFFARRGERVAFSRGEVAEPLFARAVQVTRNR